MGKVIELGCCSPTTRVQIDQSPAPNAGSLPQLPVTTTITPLVDAVKVPGGRAFVGTSQPELPEDGEGPLRRQKVADLLWERGATTVEAFSRFVAATGYVTEAERFGWSYVFYQHLPPASSPATSLPGVEWWRQTFNATWQWPSGPDGPPAELDHPVVHVSWNDATAYALWAGGRLPREAEWEHAARGGLGNVRFPWGNDEPNDVDHFPCNIWQGRFPHTNLCADGHAGTAPAISFAPNGFDLYNMVGNTWEWTADLFKVRSLKRKIVRDANALGSRKLLKGGSFLCHISYCYRYRISARTGNTADSSSSHTGFRIVYPAT